jgi:aspartyl-tRNA(Asn)/glutamyl-tRNA(Gln) amidotransferase subunit B
MTAPTLVDFAEVVERFDPTLGLEVHVELNTSTKMFCGCPTEFGAEPNTQVCPSAWACPARCRWSTGSRWSRRCASGWR